MHGHLRMDLTGRTTTSTLPANGSSASPLVKTARPDLHEPFRNAATFANGLQQTLYRRKVAPHRPSSCSSPSPLPISTGPIRRAATTTLPSNDGATSPAFEIGPSDLHSGTAWRHRTEWTAAGTYRRMAAPRSPASRLTTRGYPTDWTAPSTSTPSGSCAVPPVDNSALRPKNAAPRRPSSSLAIQTCGQTMASTSPTGRDEPEIADRAVLYLACLPAAK